MVCSPGFFEVSASFFLLTIELSKDDFPTFERPTRANSGDPSDGHASVSTLLFTNSAETIWASLAYLLRTMLEPLKILGGFSEDISVSGGIKSFSWAICMGVSSGSEISWKVSREEEEEEEGIIVDVEEKWDGESVAKIKRVLGLGERKNLVKREDEWWWIGATGKWVRNAIVDCFSKFSFIYQESHGT